MRTWEGDREGWESSGGKTRRNIERGKRSTYYNIKKKGRGNGRGRREIRRKRGESRSKDRMGKVSCKENLIGREGGGEVGFGADI